MLEKLTVDCGQDMEGGSLFDAELLRCSTRPTRGTYVIMGVRTKRQKQNKLRPVLSLVSMYLVVSYLNNSWFWLLINIENRFCYFGDSSGLLVAEPTWI